MYDLRLFNNQTLQTGLVLAMLYDVIEGGERFFEWFNFRTFFDDDYCFRKKYSFSNVAIQVLSLHRKCFFHLVFNNVVSSQIT